MWVLTSVAIVSGLMDVLAIARGWTKLRYVLKPLTMALIIALAVTGADWGNVLHRWLLAGLLLSLAGDMFLVLPSDRFISGLVSFLAAHLCYIAAFARQDTGSAVMSALSTHGTSVAVGLCVIGIANGAVLLRGVLTSGGLGLLIAIGCYVSVILAMVWQASQSGDAWVLAGAVLFMISDSILAWNRFVKPSLSAEMSVMITYYAAQLLLAFSLS